MNDTYASDTASSEAICPLCSGKLQLRLQRVEYPSSADRFDVLRCAECGLGMTCPAPTDLAPYYQDYYGGRHGSTNQRCVRRRLSVIEEVTRPGRSGALLDVGCGDGSFLLGARKCGWKVQGTEFNPHAARKKGLDVVTDIQQLPDQPAFDCITLWHSLEHLSDPLETLVSLRRRLMPGGVLVIAVPDFDGIQAKVFGRRWFHLDIPRHLYHYSKASLSALLGVTGFTPVRRWHQEFEYDLIGWPQSTLNCFLSTPNVLFQLLTGRSPRCSTAEKIVSCVGGAVLTGLALPLVAMSSLFDRGATLVIAAHPCDSY